MFGKILIIVASVSFFVSFLSHIFKEKKENSTINNIAKWSFLLGILFIVLVSVYHLFNILTHNFQIAYVWGYSSKKLPFLLLVSSFYAGQEGSFLLFTLWYAIIGIIFYYYVQKYNLNSYHLSIFSFILFYLTLFLIAKSPFASIWEAFPESNIPADFIPQDGRGLNPILENYWIAIHPPILFLGYTLVSFPFIFAVASWLKNDFSSWINYSTRWALVGTAILGLGIMLGGFWAYETLGWGGFWGWDPVENSSLVPWLFAITLVHTILLHRKDKSLLKTNYVLACLTFLFVIYATYLTRSGVLSDTSVHSFVDPGTTINYLMIGWLTLTFLFFLIVFILKLNRIPQIERTATNFFSREFFVILGSILLVVSSIIIILGTSLPIFQGWIGLKKVSLDPAFYNQWMLPIAILILLSNTIAIYFRWRSSEIQAVIKSNIIDIIVSLIATLVFLLFTQNIVYSIVFFASVFTIISNGKFLFKKVIKKSLKIGALTSHIGIAFLILGAMISGGFEQTKTINLIQGEKATAFGYQFELLRKEQIEIDKADREKYRFYIKISSQDNNSILKPIVYWSDFNNFEQPFFEPDIKTYLTKDIYIAPKNFEFTDVYPPLTLKKGESVPAPWNEKDSIKFLAYDMSSMHTGSTQNHFIFGINVEFIIDGQKYQETIQSIIHSQRFTFSPIWKSVPKKDFQIGFTKFSPSEKLEDSQAEFTFGKDTFVAEVTLKPFILLVWIGVCLTVLGFFFSLKKKKGSSTELAVKNTN